MREEKYCNRRTREGRRKWFQGKGMKQKSMRVKLLGQMDVEKVDRK